MGIWADLCIQITLDRTLYHTPFLSQRIGDTFKLSQITKYYFLFYLAIVLQKLKFPYTPNLSNWTIVKNKNRGYNIFILIACSIINWRPFQFLRHATLMISNNQRNKKHLFYFLRFNIDFLIISFRIVSLTLGIIGRSVYNAWNSKYLSTWKLFTLLFLSLQKFVIGATYYKKVYNELAYQNKKCNLYLLYFNCMPF